MKRGKVWYLRVEVEGRERWYSTRQTNKDLAEIKAGQIRDKLARGQVGLPPKTAATLKDWAPKYLAWAKVHKRSWERDGRSLDKLKKSMGALRLTEINKPRVAAYQRDRTTEKAAGATVNREVACLRKLLSHAVEAGEIDRNPLIGVRMLAESAPRQPSLSAAEEKTLLDNCTPWVRPIVRAAILTGCRVSELTNLRWRHVDADAREIVVEDSKSGDSRRVPVAQALLDELKPRRGTPDAWVFPGERGNPASRTVVTQAFKRAARAIGRGDLRLHDLRHVRGTRLLAVGANLPEVAAVLGHKTLAMARRYAHVTRTRLHDLVDAVSDAPAAKAKGEAGKGEA
jgi:integrase